MAGKYQSQDEKINNFLQNAILPALREKDLDYKKLVKTMCFDLGVKENRVIEALNNLIEMEKIKEIRILTINDDQIDDYVKNLSKKDKEIKEDFQEAGL